MRSAANVHEALLYENWLAGTFGDTDSAAARAYGPAIFDAQALTWREAAELRADPERGQEIVEAKREKFAETAEKIKEADPDAYEYLIGKRPDDRLGYAMLAGFGAVCALPFLIVSALLVLGAFLVVRFAVMLFPAFATLGVFPAARGLVIGVGRTVAAALINGTIFGVAAAVAVRGMGIILDPSSGLPGWLALVLMLLSTLVMWIATKPFRRLTSMVPAGSNLFGGAAGGLGETARSGGRWVRKVGTTATAAAVGNVAAVGAATAMATDDDKDERVERAEGRASQDSLESDAEGHTVSPAPQVVRFAGRSRAPQGAAGDSSWSVDEPGDRSVSSVSAVVAQSPAAPTAAVDADPAPSGVERQPVSSGDESPTRAVGPTTTTSAGQPVKPVSRIDRRSEESGDVYRPPTVAPVPTGAPVPDPVEPDADELEHVVYRPAEPATEQ